MVENHVPQLNRRGETDDPLDLLTELHSDNTPASELVLVQDVGPDIRAREECGLVLAQGLKTESLGITYLNVFRRSLVYIDYLLLGLKTAMVKHNVRRCLNAPDITIRIPHLDQEALYIERLTAELVKLQKNLQKQSIAVVAGGIPLSVTLDALSQFTPPLFETTTGIVLTSAVIAKNLKLSSDIGSFLKRIQGEDYNSIEDSRLQPVEDQLIGGSRSRALRVLDDADGVACNDKYIPEFLNLAELITLYDLEDQLKGEDHNTIWYRIKRLREYVSGSVFSNNSSPSLQPAVL